MSLTKDALARMYDLFLTQEEVTRKELREIDFTESDIKKLFQKGFLTRSRRGVYTFTSLDENNSLKDELLKMGFSEDEVKGLGTSGDLVENSVVYTLADAKKVAGYYNEELSDDYDEGTFYELLKRCYEANPNDIKLARTLLYRELKSGNFKYIYKYIEATDVNLEDRINNNLLLYLMQYVTFIPKQYYLRAGRLTIKDVMVHNEQGEALNLDDQVRSSIFNKDLDSAYRLFWGKELDPFQQVVHSLLGRVERELAESKSNIYSMLGSKCGYRQVQMYLFEKQHQRPLSKYEKTVLKMTRDIITIDNGRKVNYCKYDGNSFSMAVFRSDYDSAYKIFSTNRFSPSNKSNEIIKVLLETFLKKTNSFYQTVIEDFSRGDFRRALEDAKVYLDIINASEYGNYVSNLIKLAVMEEDKTFIEPASALSKIQKGERFFDTTMYIPDFYTAICDGNIEKAGIYRDLILDSRALGGPEMNAEFFNKTLEDAKARKEELAKIVGSDLLEIEDEKVSESPLEDKTLVLASLSDIVSDVKESRGVRILEKMDKDSRKEIIGILAQIPNISVSLVDDRVALRYIDLPGENKNAFFEDLSNSMEMAKRAFSLERYDEAIERFSTICSKIERPKTRLYENLGLSYFKRGSSKEDYDRALDFFYMAQDGGADVRYYIEKSKEKTDYTGMKVSQYVKK